MTLNSIARRQCFYVAFLLLFAAVPSARAALLLFDSFGLGTANNPRLNAAGASVNPIGLGSDLSGIRAEFPNSSEAVWNAPGGHRVQSWAFTASSADPNEPFSPFEPDASNNVANGTVTVMGGSGPTFPDALLNFAPPAGAIKVSADLLPGANPAVGIAIGFTSNKIVLNGNFSKFGQAWLVIRGGTDSIARTWELHTAGTNGPSASGQVPFTGGWFRLELTYDPAARIVFGSINGQPTPTLVYAVTNITAVGMEGGGQAAENFAVQTTTAGPIPQPVITSVGIQSNNVVLSIRNLTAGAMSYVEKSEAFGPWQTINNFTPTTSATNLQVETISNSASFYRVRVTR